MAQTELLEEEAPSSKDLTLDGSKADLKKVIEVLLNDENGELSDLYKKYGGDPGGEEWQMLAKVKNSIGQKVLLKAQIRNALNGGAQSKKGGKKTKRKGGKRKTKRKSKKRKSKRKTKSKKKKSKRKTTRR